MVTAQHPHAGPDADARDAADATFAGPARTTDVVDAADPHDAPGVGSSGAVAAAGAGAVDPWLVLSALALSALGVVAIASATAISSNAVHNAPQRQAGFLALGVLAMAIISRVDHRWWRERARLVLGLMFAVLVGVLVFGTQVNGATRWLNLGFVRVQPSEFAKLGLVLWLAAQMARQGERVRSFSLGFAPILLVSGFTMLLVLLERDLGTTMLLGASTMALLTVAGTRSVWVVAAMMVGMPLAWMQIAGVGYRAGRLSEWLSGGSYQVKQGLYAIGSGGWSGLGLGQGRLKLGKVPENHTDFILATIGEELGWFGVALVLSLAAVVTWRCLRAGYHATDRFGMLLATGIGVVFGLQTLFNAAVVFNVIPAKGITLPLVSYGGSSLVVTLASLGVVLHISRGTHVAAGVDARGGGRLGERARSGAARARRAVRGATQHASRNRRRVPSPTAAVSTVEA